MTNQGSQKSETINQNKTKKLIFHKVRFFYVAAMVGSPVSVTMHMCPSDTARVQLNQNQRGKPEA